MYLKCKLRIAIFFCLYRVSLSSSPTRLAQSTSSSGDYVSATEDATGGISARTLQHQRNKDRFDRLFGKTSRDLKLVRPNHSQPLKDGGVSLVTILQDNGRRNQTEDENESIKSAAQIQSTLVSQEGKMAIHKLYKTSRDLSLFQKVLSRDVYFFCFFRVAVICNPTRLTIAGDVSKKEPFAIA